MTAADDLGMIDAKKLAELLGTSLRNVWRMRSALRLPLPVSIGKRSTRWKLSEIKQWMADGCPSVVPSKKERS
jgi:prophage regulatory protein